MLLAKLLELLPVAAERASKQRSIVSSEGPAEASRQVPLNDQTKGWEATLKAWET